jgi:hypothetical protein
MPQLSRFVVLCGARQCDRGAGAEESAPLTVIDDHGEYRDMLPR